MNKEKTKCFCVEYSYTKLGNIKKGIKANKTNKINISLGILAFSCK